LAAQRVMAALDRFLATPAAVTSMSLPDRVELQLSFWTMFKAWTDEKHEYWFGKADLPGARAGFRRKLATAIRAVALTPEQIKSLPDNYDEAVRSADLFDEKGPWVCVSVADDMMAPMHTHGDEGRTAFGVFLRLPAGRQAGLDYIRKLADFRPKWIENPEPMTQRVVNEQSVSVPTRYERLLNPEAPQLPEGTAVAVVGRAVAIDTAGKLEATRCTKLVRFRVMKDIPAATAHILNPDNLHLYDTEKQLGRQDFYEFTPDAQGHLRAARGLTRTSGCAGCHQGQGVGGFPTGPGVFSVLSFTRAFVFVSRDRENPFNIHATTYDVDPDPLRITAKAEWGMLRTYWELPGK